MPGISWPFIRNKQWPKSEINAHKKAGFFAPSGYENILR
ncbi:Uncharacterized protein dnm_014820 [Desulfonema magnum]|uniref:Uncharacterized protein n=1 Tax=Desulfonema magnum TaxID=45655 RepID=A0A975BHD3_9BACT|nr:Uncharacterized protein dnm_014820 [Desulfonema magnum]